MSKTKHTQDAFDSVLVLKTMIEGNNEISIKIQTKLLKQLNVIEKQMLKTKKTVVKKEKGTSQFEKKVKISPEFLKFAGWEDGLYSRVDVTRAVWTYAKENNLLGEKDKRKCKPDEVLKQLLEIEVDEISYPMIQKFIGKHLIKC